VLRAERPVPVSERRCIITPSDGRGMAHKSILALPSGQKRILFDV